MELAGNIPAVELQKRFPALARLIARDCVKWTRVLVSLSPRPPEATFEPVLEELLAFSSWLLNQQLQTHGVACHSVASKMLAAELEKQIQHACGIPSIGARHIETQLWLGTESSAEELPALALGNPISQTAYELFCRHTGLSPSPLTGNGINLATIAFHLILFTGLVAGEDATYVQRQNLLKATQECKELLLKRINAWLRKTPWPDRSKPLPDGEALAIGLSTRNPDV